MRAAAVHVEAGIARRLWALAIAIVAALVVAPPALADRAESPDLDGPGRYYVFRTLDSGQAPTAEQEARCDEHFGPLAPLAAIRLNALLFSFRTDAATGALTDQTARVLGPGFICGGPGIAGPDVFSAYAYVQLPGIGAPDSSGSCTIGPSQLGLGPLLLGCRLILPAQPEIGLLGGIATSNSVLNPGNAIPGAPTGSVWSAYVIRKPGSPPVAAGPVPDQSLVEEDIPGVEFYVARSVRDRASGSSAGCIAGTDSARTAQLRSVQPRVRSALIPKRAKLRAIGRLTLCFRDPDSGRTRALVNLRGDGAGPTVVRAAGQCRSLETAAGPNLRQQTCTLPLSADPAAGIRGGMLTGSGLVGSGPRALPRNSAVWTLSLIGSA